MGRTGFEKTIKRVCLCAVEDREAHRWRNVRPRPLKWCPELFDDTFYIISPQLLQVVGSIKCRNNCVQQICLSKTIKKRWPSPRHPRERWRICPSGGRNRSPSRRINNIYLKKVLSPWAMTPHCFRHNAAVFNAVSNRVMIYEETHF